MAMLAIAFIGGILFARFFPVPLFWATTALFSAVVLGIAAVASGLLPLSRQRGWVLMLCLAAIAGAIRMEAELRSLAAIQSDIAEMSRMGEQAVTGTVIDVQTYEWGGGALTLDDVELSKWNRARRFNGRIRVNTGDEVPFNPGERIVAQGYVNPYRGPVLPGGFDERAYRYAQGVYAELYASSEEIARLDSSQDAGLRGFAFTARERISESLPEPATSLSTGNKQDEILALLSSLGLGIRSDTPAELRNALHASGLAHITSISGLHVSLVLAALGWTLKRCGLRRRWAGGATAVAAVLYVLFVGPRIPTLRAALMALVLIGGYFTERKVDSINSLGLAALALLLISPGELFLASFQLSFTAVLALVLFAPLQNQLFAQWPGPLGWLAQGLFASTIVVAALAPFTLIAFHDISLGAIAGNLVAVPVVGLLLPLLYIWLALPLPLISEALGTCVATLADLLLAVIHAVGGDSSYVLAPGYPGAVALTFGFVGLLLLSRPLLEWRDWGRIRLLNLHLALMFFIAAWLSWGWDGGFGRLRVDFLALGQGDCIVIRAPGGETLIVDGGPAPRSQTRRYTRLDEFLLSQGVDRIDAVFLTHPQSDHIGALPQAMERFVVGHVFEAGRQASGSESYLAFDRAAARSGAKRMTLSAGDRVSIGELELWTLHPDSHEPSDDVNEDSLVLWMRWNDFDLLLTGDIGAETEARLATRFENWDADVLKVPHHGSRYSTSEWLLRETRPEFGVIQVGRNPYGHPHIDTRQRLYAINAHVLRTDYDGTVRLQSDGERYWCYTTKSNRLIVAE